MKQQTNEVYDQAFITHDLSLSCTLLCFNFTLAGLEASDNRKVGFVFAESDELQDTIKRYWDNQLAVNPREYFNVLKDLKSRIYNQKFI
jgi:hypothetical protein